MYNWLHFLKSKFFLILVTNFHNFYSHLLILCKIYEKKSFFNNNWNFHADWLRVTLPLANLWDSHEKRSFLLFTQPSTQISHIGDPNFINAATWAGLMCGTATPRFFITICGPSYTIWFAPLTSNKLLMELKETLPQESYRKISLMGITVFDETLSPK